MRFSQPMRQVKALGLPLLAAGFVFAAAPNVSEASELGDNLLNEGADNAEVKELQNVLADKSLIEQENITGVYDDHTVDAVAFFQMENELLVDGIAGDQTIGALTGVELDDEGNLVEYLQEELDEVGYLEGSSIDGYFGENTKSSVKSFQADHELNVDGIAGVNTFSALHNAEAAVEEENTAEVEAETGTAEEAQTQETQSQEAEAQAEEQQAEQQQPQTEQQQTSEPSNQGGQEANGQTMQMEATAYTANCTGCTGITATGQDLNANPNKAVVAVDPNVIPLGSRVHVEGYGEAIAGDTGGAIQGNRIDLHVPTKDEAYSFGRQNVTVTVLD
ncbi:peptidoglycan-binding domain-containing protein [Salsuginibacillus kocurii]|uniref:peptidoglycan-binding domain-containing protein n=1 Tax=Salsuginibacillus kocurii TaxID=427078 RepID=UPI00037B5E36|nr:peptidoglycan-binding protein [Salsuginibacillus kocurii]